MMAERKHFPQKGNPARLVKDIDQARFVFQTLFADQDVDELTDGVFHWLSRMDDPASLQTFLVLPELLNTYSLDDFLEGRVVLPRVSDKQVIRRTGLAAFIWSMIVRCWNLFGEEIHRHPAAAWPATKPMKDKDDTTADLLDKMSLDELQQEFTSSLTAIVGESYYDRFINKLTPFEYTINEEDIASFSHDPELKEHMEFMLWAAGMRFFIAAVYCYFGKDK